MATDEELLVEFTQWMLPQNGNTDTADDKVFGQIVQAENKKRGKDYWFLPGTWGATKINPRSLEISRTTELVCIVATSHATALELKPGQTPDKPTLEALAKKVDGLWINPHIKIFHPDGTVEEKKDNELMPITTPVFKADIHTNNGYAKIIQKAGKDVPTITIGRIWKFKPKPGGTTKIIIAGQAAPDPTIGAGEPEYNVQVTYLVKVP